MAQSPEQMAQSMIENIPDKTGKSLDEWKQLCKASGLSKHGELVKLLKTEHGVTHGYANLIVQLYNKPSTEPEDADLVGDQYAGPKAALRPIYDALIEAVQQFGSDVEIAPKKSYVSLRRSKQFGLIQPSTKTRVDVGINLKGTDPNGRLEASGSFNAMVTHRVRVTHQDQVDGELVCWLKAAYDAA